MTKRAQIWTIGLIVGFFGVGLMFRYPKLGFLFATLGILIIVFSSLRGD